MTVKKKVAQFNCKAQLQNYQILAADITTSDCTVFEMECYTHGKFTKKLCNSFGYQKLCPKCSKDVTKARNLIGGWSYTEFVKEANLVHNEVYSYTEIEIHSLNQNIEIICATHGKFTQLANTHLLGSGCKICGKNRQKQLIAMTPSQFIKRANVVHNNKYNYSQLNFRNVNERGTITCPIHGDFNQMLHSHLEGYGCKECGVGLRTKSNTKTFDEYVQIANEKHDFKYKYEIVNSWKGVAKSNVKVTCDKHGAFITPAHEHTQSSGCYQCYIDRVTYTTDQFIVKAKNIHLNHTIIQK